MRWKRLQQDIENDPIIKDQIANLGCLMGTFGNFLAPVLDTVHTVNNLYGSRYCSYSKQLRW